MNNMIDGPCPSNSGSVINPFPYAFLPTSVHRCLNNASMYYGNLLTRELPRKYGHVTIRRVAFEPFPDLARSRYQPP